MVHWVARGRARGKVRRQNGSRACSDFCCKNTPDSISDEIACSIGRNLLKIAVLAHNGSMDHSEQIEVLGDSHPLIDVDVETMERLVSMACEILGRDWVRKRRDKDIAERQRVTQMAHHKRVHRYTAPHPLVQWFYEYDNWIQVFKADNDVPISQSAILLSSFASNLVKAAECPGFASVIERVRKPGEFFSASFEIEVAVGYVNRGWEVEFFPPSDVRTPDLKVVTPEKGTFWVECKCLDVQTERDARRAAFFDRLKESIYKQWGPNKINVDLTVRCAQDPELPDLQLLVDVIIKAGERVTSTKRGTTWFWIAGKHLNSKYEYIVRPLTGPDKEIINPRFKDRGADQFEVMMQASPATDGSLRARNLKLFHFSCATPSDRYLGALHAFRSAKSQLPEAGPGMVWIRIPFHAGQKNAEKDLELLVKKLEGEMSGEQNRRVNGIVLSSRVFSDEKNEGQDALTYHHLCRIIEHKNPKSNFPGA